MIVFLFGLGEKKDCFVITKSVYESSKQEKTFYQLKRTLSPNLQTTIYTTFKTPESFLTDLPLTEKDRKKSKNLKKKLLITQSQADELTLAKKLSCPLIITEKQLWLIDAAKKAGVKTKLYK